jgi:two-component system chemotaxis sensor kinase CheA
MDDLLSEFLTETTESLDNLDVEIVRFEQDPNDPDLLYHIFRLVHTIKGTCGFLGLPRLEALAHSAENVLGKFRDGDLAVSAHAVTLILQTLDQIKFLLGTLEATEAEPEGDDSELISKLNTFAEGGDVSAPAEKPAAQAEPEVFVPAAAPAGGNEKSLMVRIGGISAVDAAVELMYRKIMKDPELTPFFENVNMIML